MSRDYPINTPTKSSAAPAVSLYSKAVGKRAGLIGNHLKVLEGTHGLARQDLGSDGQNPCERHLVWDQPLNDEDVQAIVSNLALDHTPNFDSAAADILDGVEDFIFGEREGSPAESG